MTACAVASVLMTGVAAEAAVVGAAVGASLADDVNVSSFTILPPSSFTGNIPNGNWVEFSNNGSNFSDNFGLMSRESVDNTLANPDLIDENGSVNLYDDSPSIFTGDQFGFVAEDDFGNFFGIIDTANGDTGFNFGEPDPPEGSGTFQTTWEFDVTGAQDGLQISIDFAAMGDFEAPGPGAADDTVLFEYSFDGVSFSPAFTSGINDTSFDTFDAGFGVNPIDTAVAGQDISELPAEIVHTMDNGVQLAFNDPLTINGETIVNDFKTVVFDGIGAPSSDTLTLRLTAQLDSGSEAAAFRNIVVEDGVEVGGGLAADFNGDGTVDLLDLDILGANFGGPGDAMTGDANNDGTVDLLDLDILGSQFGQSGSTSIPEPTSLVLVAMTVAGLASRRRV